MLSRSSRNQSIDSSSLCLIFSILIMACCHFIPDPKRFNRISKFLSAVSRSSSFLATTHFSAMPSKLLSIAVQACLSSFKLSCERCSLNTSTQVSVQSSESSLNSFGFLKVSPICLLLYRSTPCSSWQMLLMSCSSFPKCLPMSWHLLLHSCVFPNSLVSLFSSTRLLF